MGIMSAKTSPTLTQTLAPPSEPLTPSTRSSPAAPCPMSTPTTSHAEWDECIRQSMLTIGSTTVAAIAIGLIIPPADTLLLLGTGAGVLWSVKRCRALMRDGLLSPEQAKALELKKRTEREEKRQQRKIEKEAKQRAADERKLMDKQRKLDDKKRGSKECCENVKKILKQKGLSADDVPCEKVSHENEGHTFKVENALVIRSRLADDQYVNTLQGHTSHDGQLTNLRGSNTLLKIAEGEAVSHKIQKAKPEMLNPEQLNTLVNLSDPYSSVKLFAPYSRYMSESVILTCDSKECTCNTERDLNCTCDPKTLSYGELQQYTIAADAESEVPLLKENDLSNLFIQQNSTTKDMAERDRNPDVQISAQSATLGDNLDLKNDVMEQGTWEHGKEEEQIPQDSENDEGELEVILSPAFDSIEPLNDATSIELIVEDNEDFDINIEDRQEGFDIEVMRNIGDEQIEHLTNKVEVFTETHKSESWPFSFSLPSLDKFSKKKNNSFKWPPLTSSIIVKPKKEPTCKCSDGSGTTKENENAPKN